MANEIIGMKKNSGRKKMHKPPKIEQLVCPECGVIMRQVWDNTGFEPPDPTHWEIVGYECPDCGHEED